MRRPMPVQEEEPPVEPISIGYRRFAGVRTRTLEIPASEPAANGYRDSTAAGGKPTGRMPGTGKHWRGRLRGTHAGSHKPSRPRFVLLHGYCDSADTWRKVLRQLAEAGHSAIAVDLPGFGQADPLRPGAILPQLDAFLASVIREQSVQGDVILVGNSLGATVSLRAGQDHSLPIAGIVSLAAPGFADSWLVRAVGRNALPLRLYSSLPVAVPRSVIRAAADLIIPRLIYADASTAEEAETSRFTMLFADYAASTLRLERARQLVGELADAYEIDKIDAPLLVVACRKDRLVSVAGGRRLHALVPHSKLLVKYQWGHCPQLDDPVELCQLITYFAASRGGGGARHHTARHANQAPPVRQEAAS